MKDECLKSNLFKIVNEMNEKSLKFYITLVLRLLVFIKNIFNSILYFFNLNFQISNFKFQTLLKEG